MTQPYLSLPHTVLALKTRYCRPPLLIQKVTMESPALAVMTDLGRVAAATIGPDFSIEAANQRMIDAGVRLLLVVGADQRVLGVITASDIVGEKSSKYQQQKDGVFGEIQVQDIMTRQADLEVLNLREVFRARVGDIVATLRYFNRQHALVVERDGESDAQRIRGIFSATQIGRQLGVKVVPGEMASTFAKLDTALSA